MQQTEYHARLAQSGFPVRFLARHLYSFLSDENKPYIGENMQEK